jgi:hypothetical protein
MIGVARNLLIPQANFAGGAQFVQRIADIVVVG